MKFFAATILLLALVCGVRSHGRLLEPVSRSTMWRYKETNEAIIPYASIVESNWNDNELFCGGFQYQQNHDGKCGICGDPWDGERANEAGGKYAKGIIVRQYAPGDLMDVRIELTAHHLGFFEMRLCKWNNPTVPATQECLNQNLLLLENGKTKYYPDKNTNSGNTWIFEFKVQLPADVTCTQCVVQWRYHAGNTWNCDDDGNCCTGCGPQEEFYGCADIAIGYEPTFTPPNWNQVTTTTHASTTTTTSTENGASTTTTTTPSTTTTSTPSAGVGLCQDKSPGKYKLDCNTFYTCAAGGAGPYEYECPPGTVYDEYREMCDYASNVPPECGTMSAA